MNRDKINAAETNHGVFEFLKIISKIISKSSRKLKISCNITQHSIMILLKMAERFL